MGIPAKRGASIAPRKNNYQTTVWHRYFAFNFKRFLPKVFENLHGLKNIVSSEIFRHTGYYMPVFCEIELFNKEIRDYMSANEIYTHIKKRFIANEYMYIINI